ncbi:Ger(x)C family spore germination protein [Paenibacillus sp. RRE4]|uniref:Ger(x)C family spore germination protein n=1 Tax=Paenibacillus sp. RRE4 TaxID=2962587 RepID=UPI0028818DF3|nr:Ger(x)C family spore germination protein [Paenibacillus sp. RRE4]MDT0123116.1 Ger(x)C family spore germination protein [Paenibacillus sp. RRE4]
MVRSIKYILLFIMLFVLTGCWNRIELNELWVTSATGVDATDDGHFLLSYQIIVPSAIALGTGGASGGASQPASHVFSMKAKTFNQALSYSHMESSRRIYLGHNRVIYIGKKAAENGLANLIDFYIRNTEARELVSIVIIDGLASDMIKKLLPPDKLQGAAVYSLIENEKELFSVYPNVRIYDLVLSMNSDSKSIGIPVAGLIGDKEHKTEQEAENLDVFKKTSSPLKFQLTKLAVIQNGKLKGFLNEEESLGVSYLTNKIKKTEISYPCSEQSGEKMYSSLKVHSAKTKLKADKSGDHYTMHVNVKVDGTLMELVCPQDVSDVKTVRNLEAEISKEVYRIITKGWSRLQSLGIDVVGFADRIHRKFPEEWKNVKGDWGKEFKKMELDIQVNTQIQRPGLQLKHMDR